MWNGITQKPTGTTIAGGTLCSASWDKTTNTSELPQIRKYGGFYVGRYEAGLAETITEFTSTQQQTGSNQVYNKDGIPQSKAGVVPWNFIDWENSQTNAKNMYNTESISSGLITGTQWDVMLKIFVGKQKADGIELTEADLTNSESWGNLMNNSIEYTGRMARAWISGSYWYQGAFGGKTTSKTTSYNSSVSGELLTTGASKQTGVYHIYDVAGNVWEWTDECSLFKEGNANETNIQHHVIRGGGYLYESTTQKACYRYGNYGVTNQTVTSLGFRVVLYMK